MWGAGPGGNPWAHQGPPTGQGQPSPFPPSQTQAQASELSLNPNHYANIPHNQVDWAALAQQWMMMKGAAGAFGENQNQSRQPSNAPHPHMHQHQQNFNMGHQHQHQHPPQHALFATGHTQAQTQQVAYSASMPTPFHLLAKAGESMRDEPPPGETNPMGDIIGEAPMEVEPLDQEPTKPMGGNMWSSSNNTWLTPDVNNPWTSQNKPPVMGIAPTPRFDPSAAQVQGQKLRPMLKQPKKQRPHHHQHQHGVAGVQNYTSNNEASHNKHNYGFTAASTAGGYWASNDDSVAPTDASHFIQSSSAMGGYSSDDNSMPDFDMAKRKTLPPWIREGLEKMERDKRRKEEEEKMKEEREILREQRIREQAILAAQNPEAAAKMSKWNQEESNPPSDADSGDEQNSTVPTSQKDQGKPTLANILNGLSAEEQDRVIMLAIRRVSTTLLVSVTNELVHEAASIAYSHAKKRKKVTSTLPVKKTSALASITGGLGLGLGYGSESEESNSSNSDAEGQDDVNDQDDEDSEEELTEEIERKKRNWEAVRLEIERELEGGDGRRSRATSEVKSDRGGESSSPGPKPPRDMDELNGSKGHNKLHDSEKREVENPTIVINKASESDLVDGKKNGVEEKHSKVQGRSSRSPSPKKSSSSSTLRDKRRSTRSKSPPRRKHRSRSKDRKRKSRSKSRDRKRRHTRSKSRSKERRRRSRSHSRSSERKRKSRSNSRDRKHRRRSHSRERKRRSRSASKDDKHNSKRSDRRSRRSRSSDRGRKVTRRSLSKGSSRSSSRDKKDKKKTKEKSKSRRSRSRSRDRRRSRSKSKDNTKKPSGEVESFAKPKQKKSEKEPRSKSNRSKSRSRSGSSSRSSSLASRSSHKDKDKKDKDKSKNRKSKRSKARSSSNSSSSSSPSRSRKT